MIDFFEEKIKEISDVIYKNKKLYPFKGLSERLLFFLWSEKNALFLNPGSRLVYDSNNEVIGGYYQDYESIDDYCHPKYFNQIDLKGVWIPESEGALFITDSHESESPLLRMTPNGREVLFLIHPKSDVLYEPLLEKYKDQVNLYPSVVLSSYRTLLVALPSETLPNFYTYIMVKLSLNETIGGVLRILLKKDCACSVGTTSALVNKQFPITFFKDSLSFLPHVNLLSSNVREAGMIYREIPDFLLGDSNEGAKQYFFPFFSFFGSLPLFKMVFLGKSQQPSELIEKHVLSKLAKIFADLIYDHSISIEAHAQNLLVSLSLDSEQSFEIDFVYRDSSGINFLFNERDFATLSQSLRNEDYYYRDTHFVDAARAFEFFAVNILYNLNRQFVALNLDDLVDPEFASWRKEIEKRGVSYNWEFEQKNEIKYSINDFCRYGYFEKKFAKLFLNKLQKKGIFKFLVKSERSAIDFFTTQIENPIQDNEWFYECVQLTYPEYMEKKGLLLRKLISNKKSVEGVFFEMNQLELVFSQSCESLFKKIIQELTDLFLSDDVSTFICQDSFLISKQKQVLNDFLHLDLMFEKIDSGYIHAPVYSGPYPYAPSLNALVSAKEFIQAVIEKIECKSFQNLKIVDSVDAFDEKKKQLKREEGAFIRSIVKDPLKAYLRWNYRLVMDGMNAKFPEFLKSVEFLILSMKGIILKSSTSQFIDVLFVNAINKLENVQKEGCPYLKTIEIIQSTLACLDVYERGRDKEGSLPGLFHSRQYQYYNYYLLGETPKHVMFPTIYDLGATDLLKMRGVPVGFLGVNASCIHVDGFLQTPFEFWFHDINHTRRMWQFYKEAVEKSGDSLNAFIQRSNEYVTNQIIPFITIKKVDSIEFSNLKRVAKILLFEILHEDAFAPVPEIIVQALLAPPGSLSAVEKMDGNQIFYMMEKSGSKLAISYWKLIANFYDTIDTRNNAIVGSEFRTKEFILQAAKYLIDCLNLQSYEPKALDYLKLCHHFL